MIPLYSSNTMSGKDFPLVISYSATSNWRFAYDRKASSRSSGVLAASTPKQLHWASFSMSASISVRDKDRNSCSWSSNGDKDSPSTFHSLVRSATTTVRASLLFLAARKKVSNSDDRRTTPSTNKNKRSP